MSFHSRWRVSAYLLLIHIGLCLGLNGAFYHLGMDVLLKIILLPVVLFDVSSLGYFAFHQTIPAAHRAQFFGGPSKVMGLLLWALILFGEFALTNRADTLWVYILLSVLVMLKFKASGVPLFDKENTFFSEGLFLLAFHFALVMAAQFPDIFAGEKSMDASFLGLYLRHQSEALADPWFANKAMGYYTFGYFLWGKVLQVFSFPLATGYHVVMATLFALCAQVLYGLCGIFKQGRFWTLVVSFGTLLLPNWPAFFHALESKPIFARFWEATRIYPSGYFAEFPLWSFAFGDLHPHVMNYPLLLTFILLLVLFFSGRKHTFEAAQILPLGLCWGAIILTNFWDAPFVAIMLIPLAINLLVRDRLGLWYLFSSAVIALGLMIFGQWQMGESVAKRILFDQLSADFLWASLGHSGWIVLLVLMGAFYLRQRLSLLLALGLVVLFFAGHAFILMDQINTVFKTQTFIFLIAASLGARLLSSWRWGHLGAMIVLLCGLFATQFLWRARSTGVMGKNLGLRGDLYLRQHSQADFEMVQWLNQNVRGIPLILEYPGKSFLYGTARMSALTGLPLYLGWDYHVQLRGAPIGAISARTQEIKSFYETIDPVKAHAWARDQGIRYIVVGDREYVAYPKLKVELFDQYVDQFKVVFKSGRARIYEIR